MMIGSMNRLSKILNSARATAFEQIRAGGERLVPVQHVTLPHHPDTWALRWSRDKHPRTQNLMLKCAG